MRITLRPESGRSHSSLGLAVPQSILLSADEVIE
jgi:hypothetical protein